MREKGKVVVLLIAVGSLSSCMWTASTPSGLREFYRGQTGLVVTGKASPDSDDTYHKTQRATDGNALEALMMKMEGMRDGK